MNLSSFSVKRPSSSFSEFFILVSFAVSDFGLLEAEAAGFILGALTTFITTGTSLMFLFIRMEKPTVPT